MRIFNRETIARVWVFGGLAYCRWGDFLKALNEIGFKLAFSTFPMLMAAFILWLNDSTKEYFGLFLDSFNEGQLFLFSSSMLGAIFYMAIKEDDNVSLGFPNRKSHACIVLLMFGFSTTVYIMKRLSMKIDLANLIDISYWFFFIALGMVILATTIGNGLKNNPNSLVKEATKNFVDGYVRKG